jgi:hypothetical protein
MNRSRAYLVLSLAGLFCASLACADTAAPAPAAQVAAPRAPAQRSTSGLDDRVRLLSAELHLDATQQDAVRRILEGQRAQVKQLWNDTSVPAAYRVSAMRAIGEHTAERIRALLNERQRQNYLAAKPPRKTEESSPTPSVEDWMHSASSK